MLAIERPHMINILVSNAYRNQHYFSLSEGIQCRNTFITKLASDCMTHLATNNRVSISVYECFFLYSIECQKTEMKRNIWQLCRKVSAISISVSDDIVSTPNKTMTMTTTSPKDNFPCNWFLLQNIYCCSTCFCLTYNIHPHLDAFIYKNGQRNKTIMCTQRTSLKWSKI